MWDTKMALKDGLSKQSREFFLHTRKTRRVFRQGPFFSVNKDKGFVFHYSVIRTKRAC